ncbi:MAG: flavin reductase [Chloroflexi bacterium]|nr:flavin reductase [Chloroflexota bacterium]
MPEDAVGAALEQMPYGLYIVGSRSDDEVNGMMADWVMQVAFEPRLVAVSLENDSHTLENVRGTRAFSVNILDEGAMELARKFAQPYYAAKIEGRPVAEAAKVYHKLEGIGHSLGETGSPILDEAMAWFECELEQEVAIGGHTLVIGRVVNGAVNRAGKPLTSEITGWTYAG